MSSHRTEFYNFIDKINKLNIRYVCIRGFQKLPEKPDTDLDVIIHLEDYDKFHEIARACLKPGGIDDFGFAEYSQMLYQAYFTKGKHDNNLPNGCFRVDTYNCLFFKSPLTGKPWTVPITFLNTMFNSRKKEFGIWIPSPECEIVLLLLRDILDLDGQWKKKHIDRINELFNKSSKFILKTYINAVFSRGEEIIKDIKADRFDLVNKRIKSLLGK
jgi:hypothetical protein